jgi:hypothetical protein
MIIQDLTMTTTEKKPITVEVEDLQASETVTSASATHTPPSGAALSITPTVATPYINMLFGPFAAAGTHFVKVQATGSMGSKPEVVYQIRVRDA